MLTSPDRKSSYVTALDGIRAIAIAAVVIFHLGATWLPGGFLGVDIFFVLSGYLITWLLIDVFERTGTINFRAFYLGRVRRLVPAFLFLVLGIAIGIGLWAPDTIERFLKDLPWAMAGLTNWWFIAEQQDYFEAIGRPSLLQHTWSLAIEAQFYVVWPALILFIGRRLHVVHVRVAAIVGAVASWATLVWVGSSATSSGMSASHMYFGTDTHSSGLFIGAALAVSWVPKNLHAEVTKVGRWVINGVGLWGLAVLAWALFNVSETTGDFYTLGFLLAGLGTAAVISSAVHPSSILRKPLSLPFMTWLGTRSYGLYLWHWVVIQVLRPGLDIAIEGMQLVVFQLLLLGAITEFSYQLIELPVRRGQVQKWLRSIAQLPRRTKRLAAVGVVASLMTPLVSATAIDVRALEVSRAEALAARSVVDVVIEPDERLQQPVAKAHRKMWVFGDSVLLGAARGFEQSFEIQKFDAEVGLQAHILIRKIRAYAKGHHSEFDVVFNIGVNGTLKPEHLPKISKALIGTARIVVINVVVPRPWQDPNNQLIAQWAAKHPNVRVADWVSCSDGHPEYFVRDGVHLTPAGVKAYVACVRDAYLS